MNIKQKSLIKFKEIYPETHKGLIHHDYEGFLQGMQGWFNIWKSKWTWYNSIFQFDNHSQQYFVVPIVQVFHIFPQVSS